MTDVRVKALREEAPAAFAFLVEQHGFASPSLAEEGLRYTRPGLTVEITVWAMNRESGFSTRHSVRKRVHEHAEALSKVLNHPSYRR